MLRSLIAGVLGLGFSATCLSCLATDETASDFVRSEGAVKGGVVDSNQMLNLGMITPASLLMEGEKALSNGDADRAIIVLRRSLDKNDNDADTHMLYAKALEMKLKSQHEKDPEIYNDCVREWLIVMRNHAGAEKGEGAFGINVLGHFYQDEDHGIDAKRHLIKLTGYAPKPWETSNKYLKRVLMPATASVSGAVMKEKGRDKTVRSDKLNDSLDR